MRRYLVGIAVLLIVYSLNAQESFPGAEGYGSITRGAYNGSAQPIILIVDDLSYENVGDEATGRGTFVWAIQREYPRIIVFEVSGTINLTPLRGISIDVMNPYISIYGQTAPSPGIMIRGGYLRFYTHDVIIQHLRFRAGDECPPEEIDAIAFRDDVYNVMVDHCSFSWSIDECIGINTYNQGHNFTFSNCIVSEALNDTYHSKDKHSKGITVMSTNSISVIKNLIAHNFDRAPFFNSGYTDIWVANNLIYNIAINRIYFKNEWNDNHIVCKASLVGNVMKFGPNHTTGSTIIRVGAMEPGSKLYIEDNYVAGVSNQWDMVLNEVGPDIVATVPEIWMDEDIILPNSEVEDYIYTYCGARPTDRDVVDERIIYETQTGTGHIIDSQNDVGGWPILEENNITLNIPLIPHADDNGDGYTILEEWLYEQHRNLLGLESHANSAPIIENQAYDIHEEELEGTFIVNIIATDPDDDVLRYSLLAGNDEGIFTVDQGTGALSFTSESINFESNPTYLLTINVSDNETPPLSDQATITINLISAQLYNNPPNIEDQTFIAEIIDTSSGYIGTVVADDPDIGQELTFEIIGGNNEGYFSINPLNGQLYLTTIDLNENITNYQLHVRVADNGDAPMMDSAHIGITLIDEQTTVYYIDPENSSDPMENGSLDHPYDNWTDVIWEDNSHYYVKRGTVIQQEKILITASNLVIDAYGSGPIPVLISTSTDFGMTVYDKANITIRNLHIIADEAIACVAFTGSECRNILVENCCFEGAISGLRIIDGNEYQIQYNIFRNKSEGIFTIAETANIYYNIFQGNETAIHINCYNSFNKIFNNVFYDNRCGLSASFGELLLYNNIFYLISISDKALNLQLDHLVSDHNIFYPEQDGFLVMNETTYNTLNDFQYSLNLDLNSFTSDPQFRNILLYNFNLDPESPAIDAGIYVGVNFDIFGSDVPMGNAPDIGSFETNISNYNNFNDHKIKPSDNQDNKFILYPNPSEGIFNLKFNTADTKLNKVEVTDITGKVILQQQYDQNERYAEEIDLLGKPKGIYFINVTLSDDLYSRKVIIR